MHTRNINHIFLLLIIAGLSYCVLNPYIYPKSTFVTTPPHISQAQLSTKQPVSLKERYQQQGISAICSKLEAMQSDYDRRQAFATLMDEFELSSAELAILVTNIGSIITSDYEKAEVLIHFIDHQNIHEELNKTFFQTLSSIHADYEQKRVLTHLTAQQSLASSTILLCIQAIDQLASDYEKSQTIIHLLQHQELQHSHILEVLAVTKHIASDYEKAQTLISIGKLIPSKYHRLYHNFLQTARSIDSDYEYQRVMEANIQTEYPN